MKKFKFKLDSTLKYRKVLKDIQLGMVAKAQNAVNETQDYLNELDAKREAVQNQIVVRAKTGFSLVEYQANDTYKRMIDKEKTLEKVRLAKRNKALEFERNKLISASKDERSIEKLKDKEKQLYQKEYLDWEMKQIDDLVNSRFGIKS